MRFFKRIFGITKTDKSNLPMSPQFAEKIIQEYGNFLQFYAPTSGCVADVGKLPYPKENIKAALIIGLKATDDSKMCEMLKSAFIQLADWQEGVGEFDQGPDLSKYYLNEDPKIMAKKFLEQTQGYEKWASIVAAEQEALK